MNKYICEYKCRDINISINKYGNTKVRTYRNTDINKLKTEGEEK